MCESEKSFSLSDVVELARTTKMALANQYITNGYRLLRIETETAARQREDKNWYTAKRPLFILGRPADVEHWQPVDA